jgi:hypothetical protein
MERKTLGKLLKWKDKKNRKHATITLIIIYLVVAVKAVTP